jgi:UDP-N-acetyl-D-mannosaminuronate dehydrogenase
MIPVKFLVIGASGHIAGKNFFLMYSPERIRTLYSIFPYTEFSQNITGFNKISRQKVHQFYFHFCSTVYSVKNIRTAELFKVAEETRNIFKVRKSEGF